MRVDVLIAGGGLNGTALALALAQAGLRVALAEPLPAETQSDQGFDGRSYALAISSQRLLSAVGVWTRLEGQAQPILGIRVSDGRAGQGVSPLTLAFDHAEIEEGPMGFMVEDRHLRPALLEAVAAEAGIERLQAAVIAHVSGSAAVEVSLGDGQRATAALLVACDGRNSATATRAGIRRTGRDYGQRSVVAAVAHERPHQGIAHQVFLPEGPLAILPLAGNRSSIVWTETAERAEAILALDDAACLALLRPRFGDFLGAITLAGIRYGYPLVLSLAQSIVAPRLALVGDAAHVVHPVAGQGLNAGLKDVGALTEVLATASRRGEDIGGADVLARYAAWRAFDTAALAASTDGVISLFSNDNPVLRLSRDLGMAAVNALPALRRSLIREAAGLTGDVPRLNRGLRI